MDTDLTATAVIRQRAEAATAGEWEFDPKGWDNPARQKEVFTRLSDGTHFLKIADVLHGSDGYFIAQAHQDIPYLLDRIEALERALVMARMALEDVEWCPVTEDGELSACPWCGVVAEKYGSQHHPNCQRQQALTEIAGVGITGADTAEVQS